MSSQVNTSKRTANRPVSAAGKLSVPISPYVVSGYSFGQRVRSRKVLWARHLGDDLVVPGGTPVSCIGDGIVVWVETRGGTKEKRNWGGVVIVEHMHPTTGLSFYSVYGHITNIAVALHAEVILGEPIGVVADGNTPENGYWKLAHLHFGIYTGPWMQKILPGYARPFEGRTKFKWWQNPKKFIESYTT